MLLQVLIRIQFHLSHRTKFGVKSVMFKVSISNGAPFIFDYAIKLSSFFQFFARFFYICYLIKHISKSLDYYFSFINNLYLQDKKFRGLFLYVITFGFVADKLGRWVYLKSSLSYDLYILVEMTYCLLMNLLQTKLQ